MNKSYYSCKYQIKTSFTRQTYQKKNQCGHHNFIIIIDIIIPQSLQQHIKIIMFIFNQLTEIHFFFHLLFSFNSGVSEIILLYSNHLITKQYQHVGSTNDNQVFININHISIAIILHLNIITSKHEKVTVFPSFIANTKLLTSFSTNCINCIIV